MLPTENPKRADRANKDILLGQLGTLSIPHRLLVERNPRITQDTVASNSSASSIETVVKSAVVNDAESNKKQPGGSNFSVASSLIAHIRRLECKEDSRRMKLTLPHVPYTSFSA